MVDDPTPASTARDALVNDMLPHRERCAVNLYDRPESGCDCFRKTDRRALVGRLDDIIALAAAEAPGRVAALEEGLERLLRFTHAAMSSKPGAPIDFDDLRFAESLAAPAPTPNEPDYEIWPPEARCGFTTDGFRCNDTPLQHRYLCWLLHSHTFLCHPFTPGARDE